MPTISAMLSGKGLLKILLATVNLQLSLSVCATFHASLENAPKCKETNISTLVFVFIHTDMWKHFVREQG